MKGSALASEPIVVIEPSARWRTVDLRELWKHRELLYFFAWRDVKVRYKQTTLGVAWAVIQPLSSMIVFAFFFGRVARLPSEGVPYPLFAYAALLPWTFFANALNSGTASLLGNAHLVTKVYFPRLLIPIAAVFTGLIDFSISLVLIVPLAVAFGVTLSPAALIWVPAGTLTALLVALGLSVWGSALVVRYRDLRHVVPFVIQIWMFATPIVYPLSMVPARWKWLVKLNPMVPVTEVFRASLFGKPVEAWSLVGALITSAVLILSGSLYFRSVERDFADVI